MLRAANGYVRHRIVRWQTKTLDERGMRRERVCNARRWTCCRDLRRKGLAALKVYWLAGIPTVGLCAALAVAVFAANLEDAVDLLGNGEGAEAVCNLEGKWRDVGGRRGQTEAGTRRVDA
jgi:hypothetical protein